jgi:hypothetical protein
MLAKKREVFQSSGIDLKKNNFISFSDFTGNGLKIHVQLLNPKPCGCIN